MLACENCGHVFDEDDAVHDIEYTGVVSEGYSEILDITRCPKCGDDYITEAHRCEYCGEWSADYICTECRQYIREALNRIVEQGMTMHRANKVRPSKTDVINAIAEVLEDIE